MLFFKFFARIQFLLTSTNQHGVHSPFVFDFITKGLYKKLPNSATSNDFLTVQNLNKKEQKIFLNLINYFQIDTIYTSVNELENTFNENYKLLLIKNIPQFSLKTIPVKSSKLIVIFNDLHSNKANQEKWVALCKNSKATVTIDLFYFGLIFFRKEQAKEHFKIRV